MLSWKSCECSGSSRPATGATIPSSTRALSGICLRPVCLGWCTKTRRRAPMSSRSTHYGHGRTQSKGRPAAGKENQVRQWDHEPGGGWGRRDRMTGGARLIRRSRKPNSWSIISSFTRFMVWADGEAGQFPLGSASGLGVPQVSVFAGVLQDQGDWAQSLVRRGAGIGIPNFHCLVRLYTVCGPHCAFLRGPSAPLGTAAPVQFPPGRGVLGLGLVALGPGVRQVLGRLANHPCLLLPWCGYGCPRGSGCSRGPGVSPGMVLAVGYPFAL